MQFEHTHCVLTLPTRLELLSTTRFLKRPAFSRKSGLPTRFVISTKTSLPSCKYIPESTCCRKPPGCHRIRFRVSATGGPTDISIGSVPVSAITYRSVAMWRKYPSTGLKHAGTHTQRARYQAFSDFLHRRVRKFRTNGSVCCACAHVTKT